MLRHFYKQLCALVGALAASVLLSSCQTSPPTALVRPVAPPLATKFVAPVSPTPAQTGDTAPPAPREFRAAWVSTVANIDWPSRSNLSVPQQQAEAITILERAKALNLNAIVLQVRPSADAIYASALEPWSEYLTGRQGQAPQPLYDPLNFWIAQAHARGLALHAWFNPYRARQSNNKNGLALNHIANTNPEVVKQYGKLLWMDPGEALALRRTLDVMLDVVRRYDIDGVQLDDYFYPYPIAASGAASSEALDGGAARSELAFPDQSSWQRYVNGGGRLERADWRRQNVNQLIEALYQGVHQEKRWVLVGISPFGIGRPDRRPPGIIGFSQYDKLYADAELWLANGWLDYLAPQLYWPIAPSGQAFDVLLDYWRAQNRLGRHIWPGLFTSRIDASAKAFTPEEIVRQISLTRSRPGVTGQLHFSMKALLENRKGIADQLKASAYRSAALLPVSPWLGTDAPAAPLVTLAHEAHAVHLRLTAASGKAVVKYAIWSRYNGQWRFAVGPAARSDWLLPDDASGDAADLVVVSAVDRLGNESERVTLPVLR